MGGSEAVPPDQTLETLAFQEQPPAPAIGVLTQSDEIGTDSSSEGSNAYTQNDSQPITSCGHEFFDENSESDNTMNVPQNDVGGTVVPGAPCEFCLKEDIMKLVQRVEVLKEDNAFLMAELGRVNSMHELLFSRNVSLMEKLAELRLEGAEATSIDWKEKETD